MNNFGYYGKTIQRGDFVRFNLPQLFVSVWDDWLQSVLIAAEQQHTQQWASIYNSASSYSFALSPGVAGNLGWIGHMSASQDKVGRRFPFCIAAAVTTKALPAECLHQYASLLDEMATLFNKVNTTELDLDALQNTLTELTDRYQEYSAEDTRVSPNDSRRVMTAGETFHSRANCAISEMSPVITARLLDDTLMKTIAPYSVWSSVHHNDFNDNKSNTDGAIESATPVTYITTGMPSPENGISLFSGNWINELDVITTVTDQSEDTAAESEPAAAVSTQTSDADSIEQTAITQPLKNLGTDGSHQTLDTALNQQALSTNNDLPAMLSQTEVATSEANSLTQLHPQKLWGQLEETTSTNERNEFNELNELNEPISEDMIGSEHIESEQLTTKDWSELETSDIGTNRTTSDIIEKPTVEPLILDDDTTTAPWEK